MSEDPKEEAEPTERTSMVGIGLALGVSFGAAFGSAFGDSGKGVASGMMLGLIIGACLDANSAKRAGQHDDVEVAVPPRR